VAASETVAGAAGGAAYPGHLLATPPSADPPLLLLGDPELPPLLLLGDPELPPLLLLSPPELPPLLPPVLPLELPLVLPLPLLPVPAPELLPLPPPDELPLPALPPVPGLEPHAAATVAAMHVMRSITLPGVLTASPLVTGGDTRNCAKQERSAVMLSSCPAGRKMISQCSGDRSSPGWT
jgi:hypothetical protein